MEVTALEAIGTVGASGGGLVGLYLLARGLWRMWSGQLDEQRKLLADARESRSFLKDEREVLKDQIAAIEENRDAAEQRILRRKDALRHELNRANTRRRQWAEYSSELRRLLIEQGVPVRDLPEPPKDEADSSVD